ncbi:hypothetical protein TruAng_005024 [Truncatella angustata]|nr:hypothetical protein TruAng_005024 [Truncatella angustata]
MSSHHFPSPNLVDDDIDEVVISNADEHARNVAASGTRPARQRPARANAPASTPIGRRQPAGFLKRESVQMDDLTLDRTGKIKVCSHDMIASWVIWQRVDIRETPDIPGAGCRSWQRGFATTSKLSATRAIGFKDNNKCEGRATAIDPGTFGAGEPVSLGWSRPQLVFLRGLPGGLSGQDTAQNNHRAGVYGTSPPLASSYFPRPVNTASQHLRTVAL